MTSGIKIAEFGALRRLNLHFDDNSDLKNRLSWYLFSKSHSNYIKERIKYIYDFYFDERLRSENTDKEFKIVRNIFKYAVPRALMLLQDLLKSRCKLSNFDVVVDFGYLIHVFENSHLPSRLSALEEMGVAIETLEKVSSDRFEDASIEAISRYLRINYSRLEDFDEIDRMFLRLALF